MSKEPHSDEPEAELVEDLEAPASDASQVAGGRAAGGPNRCDEGLTCVGATTECTEGTIEQA